MWNWFKSLFGYKTFTGARLPTEDLPKENIDTRSYDELIAEEQQQLFDENPAKYGIPSDLAKQRNFDLRNKMITKSEPPHAYNLRNKRTRCVMGLCFDPKSQKQKQQQKAYKQDIVRMTFEEFIGDCEIPTKFGKNSKKN